MDKNNLRYNILIVFVYIIGIVLLVQLFNLQIVHGEEYLEKSSSRLTRETTILAARGNILDRNGNVLAGTDTKYSLEIYKSKIDSKTLNDTLLEVVKILEANGDTYKDEFPVKLNPIEYTIDEEKRENWLKANKLSEDLTAEELLTKYKEKYEIKNDDIEEIRKIIAIRYGIEKEGYSSMSAYTISQNISTKSVAIFEEQNLSFPGIDVKVSPIRKYLRGSLASHTLGYIGSINEEEYKNKVNALKLCYKEASKKTGHIFYLPILDKSVWKITRFKDGKEDTIDKNKFIVSLKNSPKYKINSDIGVLNVADN